MNLLERYLNREFVPVFLLATGLYVFFFLVQALLIRVPWLDTLPLGAMVGWLLYQVPGVALKAFPLAMMLAVLLVFGRMAREQELFAMQLAGLSLARVARSMVVFAALLVGLGLWMMEFVIPTANERTKLAWWDSVDGGGIAVAFLAGRQIEVGNFSLYFSGYHKATRELREVRLESWDGDKRQFLCFARGATLENLQDPTKSAERGARGVLTLRGYSCRSFDHTRLPLASLEAIKEFITAETTGPDEASILRILLPYSRDTVVARNLEGGFEDPRAISTLWREWLEGIAPANRLIGVELSTKIAWPFASLVLLLLSLPLAASSTRSTSTAMGLAFLLAAAYYLLFTFGQTLGQEGLVHPLLAPWMANMVFIVLGAWLIRRNHYR